MPLSDRVLHPGLRRKIMSAEAAAALIPAGANVGTSGFTGAGYPKAVPQALAQRIKLLHADGEDFQIGLWTGASTAPELDGALAKVHGIEMRLPYQSDPAVRKQINNGQMQYTDIHLSHVAQFVWFGFLGHLDVAVIEVAGILPDGRLIPSSSVGNNKTWLDQADKPSSWRSTPARTRRWRACTTSTTAPSCRRTAFRSRCCSRATASASPTCAAIRTR
jgi:succinyl-CoA:acetate CoA-transferase